MTQLADHPPVPSTAQCVAHFVRSIREVLLTMAHVAVAVGSPALKTTPATTYDVSGIIGFSGGFKGSMVLSFQKCTAAAIVCAFAGVPIEPDSPDFADAVGELANMIAGSAKTGFGHDTSISVPSIIMGTGHVIARLQDVPCIIIPCKTAHGDFAVEVSLKSPDSPVSQKEGIAR
jgi:chemotaxis protein CheX